jgi:hypothetical protein
MEGHTMKIGGLVVKDADEKVVVHITKDDVRKGSLKKSNSCAAAQALCREGHCDEARVHFSRAYLRKGKKWTRYVVNKALRSEVLAFDRGGVFEPGEYILAPVQPTVRLDAPAKRPRGIDDGSQPKRGNRTKRPYHVVTGVRAKMMADWE